MINSFRITISKGLRAIRLRWLWPCLFGLLRGSRVIQELFIYKKGIEDRAIDRRSYLINFQYFWAQSWVDLVFGRALQNRGHDVTLIVCDGAIYCENEVYSIGRPSCKDCFKCSAKACEAFGLKFQPLSNFSKPTKIRDLTYANVLQLLGSSAGRELPMQDLALRNLLHFSKGKPKELENNEVYLRCLVAGAHLADAWRGIFDGYKQSTLITVNGKLMASATACAFAKKAGVDFYTWDVFTQFAAATLARNEIALEQNIDQVWPTVLEKRLSENDIRSVLKSFNLQSRGLNTPYKYYKNTEFLGTDELIRKLGVRRPAKIVVYYSNVVWDSTAIGLDTCFADSAEAAACLVKLLAGRDEFFLVIVPHPGEEAVPYHLKTKYTLFDNLQDIEQFAAPNIRYVSRSDGITSYDLARLADINLVYTSTFGLELAINGIRPVVCARPYYSNKGFTVDIREVADMEKLFQTSSFDGCLSSEERSLAIQLAKATRFDRLFNFFFLDNKGRYTYPLWSNFHYSSGHDQIRSLCHYLEGEGTYLDIDSRPCSGVA